ncbi:hypothetical protein [Acinetobacter sp. MD2]|uniref:hypothetical protein n=1 Tax=Acinetobacter sp. MD2 TaxID=2600066 RepID=UPI002D1E83A4|nr:hypothetical protein [Acinetobacter sp. MD2]MEB3766754.1 hypothetical protein [Acinetobacter sp. MD2]
MKQMMELAIDHKNIACVFCQHEIINWEQEQYLQPCEHTAFIALDLGFEFIADAFEVKLKHSVDEIHDQELNVFTEIETADAPDLIVFKQDLGAHGLYRYVGMLPSL